MTPKEKAKELVKKHLKTYDIKIIALESSIITVDEILKQYKKIIVSHNISAYVSVKEFNTNLTNIQNQLDYYVLSNSSYWMQVKQELKDLEDTTELDELR